MARTRLWSAIHHKLKMSMAKGSLNGVAETAWIVAPPKKRNRRPPDVAQLGASLQRCAVVDSNNESIQKSIQKKNSHAPLWMTNLEPRPPPLALDVPPHILLLVGVPGSGKSTLTETLCRVLPWKYRQVNQDTLGHRKACLSLTQEILDEGLCPIIDRCNVSRKQRQFFTAFRRTNHDDALIPVDCIVLKTVSIRTCVRRCKNRGADHPTLPPNAVDRVMRMLQKEWELPSLDREPMLRSVTTVTSEEMLQHVVQTLLEDAVGKAAALVEDEATEVYQGEEQESNIE